MLDADTYKMRQGIPELIAGITLAGIDGASGTGIRIEHPEDAKKRKNLSKGIRAEVDEGKIALELDVNMEYGKDFMQLARERSVPLPRAVVTRIDITYHHPSTLRDAVRIRTRARFESDFRAVFEQEAVLEEDGTRLAEATTDMAFVDAEGNPAPCPVREALEID